MSTVKKYLVLGLLNVVLTLPLSAQNDGAGNVLLQYDKLVAVITVLLIILVGIVIFLVLMERRIKRLENQER